MQRVFLLAIAASTLSAQFSEFAVTDDGRLYFDSQLNTATGDGRIKIYRITGDGLSVFATGASSGQNDDLFGPSAIFPLTSGDGSITGYAINYPCRTGSCGLSGLPRSFFELQGVTLTVPGFNNFLQISRNGRFLLGTSAFNGTRLVELPSQRERRMPQSLGIPGTQCVANTGAALMREAPVNAPLHYVPLDGEPALIPGTETATMGILSPDGSRVAYERANGAQFELLLTDPQGSAHRVLGNSPIRSLFKPSFANDGTLLYLQPDSEGRNALPILLTAAGERRTLSVLSGVTQAIISGNAQLVWLATATGQLLRVRMSDGVADEIIPETPLAYSNSFFAVPGSVIRVPGSGLTPRTQFQLSDTALPVSELTATEAALQIPWEYDVVRGSRELTIRGPASPFHQRASFSPASEPTISFERIYIGGALQAAHQDFRGIVTADDPARPGETLHVFARNMGPVDRPVATGGRSPSSPPARVTTPLACYLIELDARDRPVRSQAVVVPFAGLSGGTIGIYQIDVTIPADWTVPKPLLQCRMESQPNRFLGDSAPIHIASPTPTSPTP